MMEPGKPAQELEIILVRYRDPEFLHTHTMYAMIYNAYGSILVMPPQTDDVMAATSIRVKTETRDRLNETGLRNESFDDIINRILDENKALKQAVKLRKR